jgi:hypothetical protein
MSDAFWIDESRGIFGRDHDLYLIKDGKIEMLTPAGRGPPLASWTLLGFAAGILVAGAVIASAVSDFGGAQSRTVHEFADQTSAQIYTATTVPVDIELRIMDHVEYEAAHPGTLAVSYPHRSTCRIVIPAGWSITFRPASKAAVWDNSYNGAILAHEILHCLRGSWHPNE